MNSFLLDWQKLWARTLSPQEFLDIAITMIGDPIEPNPEENTEQRDQPEDESEIPQNNQPVINRGKLYSVNYIFKTCIKSCNNIDDLKNLLPQKMIQNSNLLFMRKIWTLEVI